MDESSHLNIGCQSNGESKIQMHEGYYPSYKFRGPQYVELIISMVECEGLTLVTLARIEKWPK